jgi:hypothetical protein
MTISGICFTKLNLFFAEYIVEINKLKNEDSLKYGESSTCAKIGVLRESTYLVIDKVSRSSLQLFLLSDSDSSIFIWWERHVSDGIPIETTVNTYLSIKFKKLIEGTIISAFQEDDIHLTNLSYRQTNDIPLILIIFDIEVSKPLSSSEILVAKSAHQLNIVRSKQAIDFLRINRSEKKKELHDDSDTEDSNVWMHIYVRKYYIKHC